MDSPFVKVQTINGKSKVIKLFKLTPEDDISMSMTYMKTHPERRYMSIFRDRSHQLSVSFNAKRMELTHKPGRDCGYTPAQLSAIFDKSSAVIIELFANNMDGYDGDIDINAVANKGVTAPPPTSSTSYRCRHVSAPIGLRESSNGIVALDQNVSQTHSDCDNSIPIQRTTFRKFTAKPAAKQPTEAPKVNTNEYCFTDSDDE